MHQYLTIIGAILAIIAIIWVFMKWNILVEYEKIVIFILISLLITLVIGAYYIGNLYDDLYPFVNKIKLVDEPIQRIRSWFD